MLLERPLSHYKVDYHQRISISPQYFNYARSFAYRNNNNFIIIVIKSPGFHALLRALLIF